LILNNEHKFDGAGVQTAKWIAEALKEIHDAPSDKSKKTTTQHYADCAYKHILELDKHASYKAGVNGEGTADQSVDGIKLPVVQRRQPELLELKILERDKDGSD
jgi:hypothetical protein